MRLLILTLFLLNISALANTQILGCKEQRAINFNPAATTEDGSCSFRLCGYKFMENNFLRIVTYSKKQRKFFKAIRNYKKSYPQALVSENNCIY